MFCKNRQVKIIALNTLKQLNVHSGDLGHLGKAIEQLIDGSFVVVLCCLFLVSEFRSPFTLRVFIFLFGFGC